MNHETEHKDAQREDYWMHDNQAMLEILEKGAQGFMDEKFKDLEINEHESLTCSCIDERVGGNKLALPGSGILAGDQKAFEILKAAGVDAITSHADCGAASLAFGKLSAADQEKYGSADVYAQEWSRQMAEKLGIKYVGHIGVESPGQHIARTVYYDATGNFRADNPNIPRGFTVSRKFIETEEAQESLELSLKIAFGDHGFKEYFTPENPLVIIPIGNEQDLSVLSEEIATVVKQNPQMADKIRIDQGVVFELPAQEKAA